MDYLEYTFRNFSLVENEIIIAFLDQLGYKGFIETEEGFLAYLPVKEKDERSLTELFHKISPENQTLDFRSKIIPETNWNARWESDFQPVEVANKVRVQASFHDNKQGFDYTILINPKMSFGTGHHQTTRLMIKALLDIEVSKKNVLDMGTGTGILSILASMIGADKITAIDTDKWACENSTENIKHNQCENITIIQGDVEAIGENKYDLILANINRNVLLADIHKYDDALNREGLIIISGILKQDMDIVKEKAHEKGLKPVKIYYEDDWVAMRLSH